MLPPDDWYGHGSGGPGNVEIIVWLLVVVLAIAALAAGCAVGLCHPDDTTCWGQSSRSMERMDPKDVIRELEK